MPNDVKRNRRQPDAATVPPQNVEAEQAVLGGLMLDPDALDGIRDKLEPGDFYRRDHQNIYRAILDLDKIDKPYDAVTLGEWFRSKGLAESVADGQYLIELSATTPSAGNIQAYAEIVKDKSVLRSLIDVSSETMAEAYNPEGEDTDDILSKAERRIYDVANGKTARRDHSVSINKALAQAFDVIQDRYQAGGNITGLATGYDKFDELTTGLQPTDLIILAARPAQGKTTLALNIAEYAAVAKGTPALVFSMEMSTSQLAMRLISSAGRVNAQRIRTGQLEDEDWGRVTDAIRKLKSSKIFIDDTPALSPEEVRSRARRKKREENIGLIVIDYLQLMQVPGTKETRANEISEISRSLKALAKELNVPVIALSQLNRGVEQRQDKRPVMSDLRESGGIEQDADVIIFIYRDEYYNEDSPDKGLAEIIIGKQRNGPTGMVKLKFFGEFCRFDPLSSDDHFTF